MVGRVADAVVLDASLAEIGAGTRNLAHKIAIPVFVVIVHWQ